MNTISIEKAFQKLGVPILVTPRRGMWANRTRGVSIDIQVIDKKETYVITYSKDLEDDIELQVLDIRPDIRHLLLLVKTPEENARPGTGVPLKEKFLCGHDERHWFASVVNAKNVAEALTSLKPADLRTHEKRLRVKRAHTNKHHNAAFTRQGEWFFIPAPDFDPGKNAIIYQKEPISRGRGSKPHICEELVRRGGEVVYVSREHPNGLTKTQYEEWIKSAGSVNAQMYKFQQRMANAEVYVRGKVRHPDHSTINLKGWHRVQLNGEVVSDNLRFLD